MVYVCSECNNNLPCVFTTATEAETVNLEDKENAIQNEYRKEDYIVVGKFTPIGLAAGTVPVNIGPLAELRIRVIGHKNENWVALSEVRIN